MENTCYMDSEIWPCIWQIHNLGPFIILSTPVWLKKSCEWSGPDRKRISRVLRALFQTAAIRLSVHHCCCLSEKHRANQSRTARSGKAASNRKMLLFRTDCKGTAEITRCLERNLNRRRLDVSQTGIFLIFWSPFRNFLQPPSVSLRQIPEDLWKIPQFLFFTHGNKTWQAMLLKRNRTAH